MHLAVAPDFQVQPLGEGVHHGDTDAVEASGDLVTVVVELSACVKNGQDDFSRGLSAFVAIDWNSATIIMNFD